MAKGDALLAIVLRRLRDGGRIHGTTLGGLRRAGYAGDKGITAKGRRALAAVEAMAERDKPEA